MAVTAGCADTATTAPKVSLTATLVPPVDIKLAWRDRGPTPAGRIVEFANAAAGPYTILGFLPPGQMSYDHRDLIPQTAFFYYRVVPYYGGRPPRRSLVRSRRVTTTTKPKPRTTSGPSHGPCGSQRWPLGRSRAAARRRI
ncbi:hypothetical protein [Fodinicola feengrottensis]|uniref:hypothetical protein n=1 Tax=Fodinicola feengrottensis TaxID=435914 RepID=UPI0024423A69|nr:hypothetical protein [Fodinicola feengrottensis]